MCLRDISSCFVSMCVSVCHHRICSLPYFCWKLGIIIIGFFMVFSKFFVCLLLKSFVWEFLHHLLVAALMDRRLYSLNVAMQVYDSEACFGLILKSVTLNIVSINYTSCWLHYRGLELSSMASYKCILSSWFCYSLLSICTHLKKL